MSVSHGNNTTCYLYVSGRCVTEIIIYHLSLCLSHVSHGDNITCYLHVRESWRQYHLLPLRFWHVRYGYYITCYL